MLALLPGVSMPANTGGNLRALTMLRALDAAFDLVSLSWAREKEDIQALDRTLRGRAWAVVR